ncbi:MAG: ATP-binding cassette domain-containing protein [Desulfuromonadaceae bacterium]|nr:ATP-binding cassette domain-containing protein [Desulfuromonadaceae bacterium]MDD5107423.1 ATP-binding cassette domain-containing protein [Desulfuromonadaceae bacterium]
MTKPVIELKNVSYRYPDGTAALTDCSLALVRGSRTAVLGSNGAGKTTLFLHLNGLLHPAQGKLLFDSAPFDYSRAGLRSLRSKVGLVFQNPDSQLFSACVREDVSFGPMNMGLAETIVRQRVEDALEAVDLLDSADKPVHNLSYGQKKRVCIAGVLAMQPELLLLDEPMAGLDTSMQEHLTGILDELHSAGMTIIIATHDLDFVYSWADEAVVLQQGRLLAGGSPTEVFGRADVQHELGGEPFVAEIARSLSLLGIDLRDKEYIPRSTRDLLKALSMHSTKQEKCI